ncbi:hypothetical protein CDH05_24520 [Pseudomonas lactis]|nr:hypothetical protein CDH05_24520 [Pseudomonas lactis]
MLAKNVNDNACLLNERGAYEFFASKLAPTEGRRQKAGFARPFLFRQNAGSTPAALALRSARW